jgi:hypothetical protein
MTVRAMVEGLTKELYEDSGLQIIVNVARECNRVLKAS